MKVRFWKYAPIALALRVGTLANLFVAFGKIAALNVPELAQTERKKSPAQRGAIS